MKIAVCVKEVPDTTAEKRIDPTTFRLVRDEGDRMLNEFDKYAVEEAIRLKEAGTADEVILISLGPEKAVESLRQALAMGADRLVLVSDPAAAGSDYLGTAKALAKALEETGAELVLLGAEATDARSGVLAAVLGEVSGRAWVTSANSLAGNGATIKLLTNLLWFVSAAAIGEGLMLGAKAGIPLHTVWEAIKSSAGNSWVAEHDVPSIFAGHYPIIILLYSFSFSVT